MAGVEVLPVSECLQSPSNPARTFGASTLCLILLYFLILIVDRVGLS